MLYVMTALKYILPFIITALLTRNLGAEAYGLITYANAVMSCFMLLCEFGFNYSATRRISLCREDKSSVSRIFSEVMTAKLLLAVLGFAIMCLLALFTPTISENFGLFVLFYLAVPFANILVPDFVYRGLEKMEYVTLRYAVGKALSVVLIVIFVKNDRDILRLPLAYFISNAFAAGLSISHLKKSEQICLKPAPIINALLEMKSSFSYFIAIFATLAFGSMNTLVLDYAGFARADIACWGIAVQLISAIQSLYEPITSCIYPHAAAKKNYSFAVRLTAILLVPVALGCAAAYYLSDFAVSIVAGDGYDFAAEIFRRLIPVLLFSFPAQMLGFPVLGAAGKQHCVTSSVLIAAAVQVIGLFMLSALNILTIQTICTLRCTAELTMCLLRAAFSYKLLRGNKKISC